MKKRHFRNHAELTAAIESGEFIGKAMHLLILHDDACSRVQCVCDPEFVIEDLTVETILEGQAAQAKWLKETSS